MIPGRRQLPHLALVALGAALLFPRAIFLGETFALRDLERIYRPWRWLLAELWRTSGGIPYWNPYCSAGQPFAGNPNYAVFHPLSVLFHLLPFELAFRLQVILPPLLAIGSMYFLLRTLGRSGEAAAYGGLCWGFGGYLLSTTSLLPILYAQAALPAALGFTVRLARAGQGIDAAGLALATGLVALAGEPSTLLASPPLFAAAWWVGSSGRLRASRLFAALGASALAAAIAAPTLLPAWKLAGKGGRLAGIAPAEADLWSLPPQRALELALPGLLGEVERGVMTWHAAQAPYRRLEQPLLLSLHAGLLLGPLLALALLRRARESLPWILAGALGFLLACGEHLPAWALLRRMLPIFGAMRYPEKLAFLFVLAAVLLAARGFDLWREAGAPARRIAATLLVVIAALAAGGALLRGEPRSALWPALAGTALAFGLVGGQARVLLAASLAELVVAGRPLVPTTPPAELDAAPPFLRRLIDPPLDGALFHAAALSPRGVTRPGLAQPPITARFGIATLLEQDLDVATLAWTQEANDAFWKATRRDAGLARQVLARRGVAAVLTFAGPGSSEGGDRLELSFLVEHAPRLFLAEQVVAAPDQAAWLEAAERLGARLPRAALVSDSRAAALPARPSPGRIAIDAASPVRLGATVEIDGPEPGFLAFNQTWDDGWRADIDGRETALLRTEISLSGLIVPPGRHRVELRYVDRSIRIGVALALVALLATLWLSRVRAMPIETSATS